MNGYFSQEAMEAFTKAVGEENFSESLFDFTRCVRPDGSAYGTSGKCKAGTEEAKQEDPKEAYASLIKKRQELLKRGDLAGATKLNGQIEAAKQKVQSSPAKVAAKEPAKSKADAKPESADDKTKKAEDLKKAHQAYTDALKKQMEYVAKGDMASAEKMGAKVKAAIANVKKAEEAKRTPEQKAADREYAKERIGMLERQKQIDAAQDKANLNAAQKKALKDYTGTGSVGRSYAGLNDCLRNPSNCRSKKEAAQFTKELDNAIKALPKNEAGNQFYRGVSATKGEAAQLYKSLENAKPGTVLKDPGFGSYSSDRRQAEFFISALTPASKNILFVSRNKSLTPINRFSDIPKENEAIMPRGTAQTIRSVTKKGGTLIIEFD